MINSYNKLLAEVEDWVNFFKVAEAYADKLDDMDALKIEEFTQPQRVAYMLARHEVLVQLMQEAMKETGVELEE